MDEEDDALVELYCFQFEMTVSNRNASYFPAIFIISAVAGVQRRKNVCYYLLQSKSKIQN